MSNLEDHMAEQDEITALCEAGECDHPECHEDAFEEAERDVDRYLAVVAWAKARYRNENGRLTTFVGCMIAGRSPASGHWGVPTRYTMIEDLAARLYLGTAPRFPHETLATAHRG
jgi:hypothetical protein